ncbi:MAG TPA: glycosyltransferase [Mycobacteriales bacterium]|nr:glycosyltransferase [Mycobacteriales bacterium]
MSRTYRAPLVVVTVGGDHHPFNRLMDWVEDWLVDQGDRVRCFVQHGPSRAPVGANCEPYLNHQDLLALMRDARAVVSSGGPATLSEARFLGHQPVAIPRLAKYGEVVDDHQLAFTSRLQDLGYVVQAQTEQQFRAAVARAIDLPRLVPAPVDPAKIAAIGRVGTLIDATAAVHAHRGWSAGRRLRSSATR